jgi:hypothetical protein
MRSRYFVASGQNLLRLVVLRHIDGYVCAPLNLSTSINRGFGPPTAKHRFEPLQILWRHQLVGRRDPHSGTTSSRIPILSP